MNIQNNERSCSNNNNGILGGLLNYVHDSLDTILEDSIKVFKDDNK